ncbi:hypothetical protein HU200_021293 [Digitaria exilis]|uniref:CP12 domain-containing protein n=1 Tax=Digitaria exilis TaxID=1010633 RepID=A0A835F045_9POAL|nr:hypothetical protein HU200_021293 [Digitaria exilis]CAB3472904.1 unnamed protein product [Digitaria exilis]
MASTVASLSTPATFAAAADVLPRRRVVAAAAGRVWFPAVAARRGGGGFAVVRSSGPATPPGISDQVSDSIKKAEETCAEEKDTGDCAAAWDEVEELSAAASHARDKLKGSSDPLEEYCKENPETDECRVYDN